MDVPKQLLVVAGENLAEVKDVDEFMNAFSKEDYDKFMFDNYCSLLYYWQMYNAQVILGEKVPFMSVLNESLTYWRKRLSEEQGKFILVKANDKVKKVWEELEKSLKK